VKNGYFWSFIYQNVQKLSFIDKNWLFSCPAPNHGTSLFGAGQCGSPLNYHFYGDCNYTKPAGNVQYISNILGKKLEIGIGGQGSGEKNIAFLPKAAMSIVQCHVGPLWPE